jgi:ankyrin repeat protein
MLQLHNRGGKMKKIISVFCLLSGIVWLAGFAQAGEIHEATKSGDLAKMRALLDKNPQLISEKDDIGKTPVHWAVGKGQPAALKLLLDTYHADVNIRNNNGGTPLHVAASQAQPECARILIKHGADVNARTRNDSTPLHFAAFKAGKPGHFEVARILLEHGADVNAKIDTGATALSMAMYRNSAEMIALLKEHGAKPGSMSGGQRGQRSGAGNYYLDDQGM